MEVKLFINHYADPYPKRNREIQVALDQNLALEDITRIYLVCDRIVDFPDHPKIELVVVDQRPTYSDFFQIMQENGKLGDVLILANSDISFTGSLRRCVMMGQSDCYALSRWDLTGSDLHPFHRADSQDTWIFRSPLKDISPAEFTMGKPGCDNKIAWILKESGYHVTNPCKSIITVHHHQSNLRRYKYSERIQPPYFLVKPE
jgi:hypothetical protein